MVLYYLYFQLNFYLMEIKIMKNFVCVCVCGGGGLAELNEKYCTQKIVSSSLTVIIEKLTVL